MERKSYYVILGVSPREEPRRIRAAYRELARKLHPDVAGEQGTSAFHEITEAYQVLSDPQRRRDYDASLRRSSTERATAEFPSVATARRPLRAEPLVWQPMSILEHPDRVSPSFEAMFERFLRNFTGLGVSKSERLEPLDFEVVLTQQEAARGSIVPISVPVFQHCPRCGGSGRDRWSGCRLCGEHGWLQSAHVVRIRLGPGVPSGSVIEVSLQDVGIDNLYLRLHLFVQD